MLMIIPNSWGSEIIPFTTHELHTFSDGRKRLWVRDETENSFMRLMAMIGNELEEISADEYLNEVNDFVNQQIEYYNELVKQLKK